MTGELSWGLERDEPLDGKVEHNRADGTCGLGGIGGGDWPEIESEETGAAEDSTSGFSSNTSNKTSICSFEWYTLRQLCLSTVLSTVSKWLAVDEVIDLGRVSVGFDSLSRDMSRSDDASSCCRGNNTSFAFDGDAGMCVWEVRAEGVPVGWARSVEVRSVKVVLGVHEKYAFRALFEVQ